jgi:exopolysaccharide biosynthesis polyprenyl glycosylphosphotransferase
MIKNTREITKAIQVICDLFTLSICWAMAYAFRFHILPVLSPTSGIQAGHLAWPVIRDFLAIMPFMLFFFMAAYALFGLYNINGTSPWHKKIGPIFLGTVTGWVFSIATLYYYRENPFSRIMLFSFLCVVPIGIALSHLISRKIIYLLNRTKIFKSRHIAIVGSGKLARRIVDHLQADSNPFYSIKYLVETNGEKLPPTFPSNITYLPDLAALWDRTQHESLDGIIVAIPRNKSQKLEHILQDLGKIPVPIYYVPDLTGVLNLNIETHRLGEIPLIQLYGSGMGNLQALIKRMMDVAVSILLLTILALPMILLSIAIKLTSGGPVLYRQKRMSLGGRPFILYKFRSMYQNAEEKCGPVWTREKDPRCTPLGRIMRKTCLDELPQLFNVLKGEMSLVGPRPERPFFVNQFMESLPTYMVRHNVKAGVTGWAQLNGFRGNSSVSRRLEHDLYYIQNWSLAFDLWILIATPFAMLFHRHGY